MANPQLEDGYTKISNQIIDALAKVDLNGTEQKVLWCIFRYTYGFNRKSHKLSATFIAKYGNCSIEAVKKAIKRLKNENIVLCVNSEKRGVCSELMFNKNFDEWKSNQCTNGHQCINVHQCTNGHQTSVQTDTATGVQSYTQEIKNINKKSKENIYEHFFEKAWQAYPKKKGKSAVNKKAKKELYEAGEETVMGAIGAYKREIESNETAEQFVLYGSTFFNGRWRDYVQQQEKKIAPAQEDEEPPIDYSNYEREW